MKMTYGSIIRKETRPFYMALNTILAYEYEYNGGIRIIIIIIISDEYKLKVNKWCLYQAVFVLHVFFIINYILVQECVILIQPLDTKCYKLMGRTHP